MTNSVAQAVIKRDRNIVLAGLTAVIGFAAYYTISMALEFNSQASFNGGLSPLESLEYVCGLVTSPEATEISTLTNLQVFWMLFIMWTVMQVAMMSPTAVPMVLMYTKIERHRQPDKIPYQGTILFFCGYLLIWMAFSAVFALFQLGLENANLLTSTMSSATLWLAGGLLIAAGLFQFSKLKQACLNECRSPVTYLMTDWRSGLSGALKMGIKHGLHCVGCCWVLMALLFVAGVMNLLWMAVITAVVLIEKIMPQGVQFGKLAGLVLVIWGTAILILG
ncbi:MAG: DUF2182 domain-containing protein [Chloroflexi bacterium]|nr:DUF2182 domain-containing protein [Chloroflexota bacterium]